MIEGVTLQLGGAGLTGSNPAAIGYYSIIGIPNSGSATLSPEVRSWAMESAPLLMPRAKPSATAG